MSEVAYSFEFGWRVPSAPPPPTRRAPRFAMREIVEEVAARHNLNPRDLTGPMRFKSIVRARFEAMWLIYEERHPDGRRVYSLPQVGAYFNRDHTTVLYALRRYEQRTGRMAA